MNYWLHRISYLANVSYPLLENGYLSIGFSDFCEADFLEKVSEQDWEYLENQFDGVWGNRTRNRHSLWRFLADMDKGDWVIVPSWGTFSIYEITDARALLASDSTINVPETDWSGKKIIRDKSNNMLKLEGEKDYLDIGFLRRVKPIAKEIPRYEFADAALTARMKIRTTNANIEDLENSINNALSAFRNKEPINLKAMLVEKTVSVWHSIILEELNADKFEKLVKWYFNQIGATDTVIPSKNSADKVGDVDVIATFENIKTIINVQVKYYSGETSDWAIRQIVDFSKSKEIMFDGYLNQYWVVSSSDTFSEDSYNQAREQNILLVDGKQFVRMLLDIGIGSLEKFLQ
jgi:predicted Mrr-cat superfamily restriction endonuclease